MSVSVIGNVYSIEFSLPFGVRFGAIALYADGGAVQIGAGTRVLGAVRGFGSLVSMSGAPTEITGAGTEVGDVFSQGDIEVGAGARVNGRARSDGAVNVDPDGFVELAEPEDWNLGETFSLEVEFPSTNQGNRTAAEGTLLVLEPGDYADVDVEADASLELASGRYLVDSLTLDASARLRVRANGGPVEIFVRQTIDFSGALDLVAGDASQFRLVYLGTSDIHLAAPFFASVLAPRALLRLEPGSNSDDAHVGAFFAESLETAPATLVRQQAFFVAPESMVVRYFYGFSGEVGAGPYARVLPVARELSDVISGGAPLPELFDLPDPERALTIADSRTYALAIRRGDDDSERITTAVLQADEGTRPFVTITGDDGAAATLTPASRPAGATSPPRRVEIDGVWLGTDDDAQDPVREFVIASADPPAETGFDWDEIVLRHTTVDPGGLRADRTRIAALKITVRSRVRTIRIERSIVGAIEVADDGLLEELSIRDSIVDATQVELDDDGRRVAIRNVSGRVELGGVTVFGDVQADVLEASDTVVTGQLVVADTQASCFRFSATSEGPKELQRLPRLFSSRVFEGGVEPHFFVSQRFGDPGYGRLSRLAPDFLHAGAEDGLEIGVFSFLHDPLRLQGVLAKIAEFKPVGVLDQYVFEGEQPRPILTGTGVVEEDPQ